MNITLSNLMPVSVWLKLLPFYLIFFYLLVVAFASTVSIAGNKLHTSGTEALNREILFQHV